MRAFFNLLMDKWINVKDKLPAIGEEVIVLSDNINGQTVPQANKISFGHLVDRRYAMDYDGWNIPGVLHWLPCPPIED